MRPVATMGEEGIKENDGGDFHYDILWTLL
jgi:hypothetical protein